eukprot:4294973-Amphidinium_carterae.2
MSKKSKHIELRYLHLQGLVESGVNTVYQIGTLNNPSNILTKFMPQASLTKHFSKVGIAEVGIDEVSILTSGPSSRTPKSKKKCKDDSLESQVRKLQREQRTLRSVANVMQLSFSDSALLENVSIWQA